MYAACTDTHRSKIENLLRPLLQQYRSHFIGGGANCLMCPEVDAANLQAGNKWPWLQRLVTGAPHASSIASDTSIHPHSPFPDTPPHTGRAATASITSSPPQQFSEFFTPTSATIQTGDKTSDHHPVTYTSQIPPHPFSETPSTKRKVFRILTQKERSTHVGSLAAWAKWCESTLPRFYSLSSADIECFTGAVLE